tara:strand:- start:664 stop:1476 length:813 start_codon:yes stop_codon:yes gene_type:complete
MITTNTFVPFVKSENSENKFYLSQLTSEYEEGVAITTGTKISCKKLTIALKAGDKITINGTSLTIYADAAVDAVEFYVEAITLENPLELYSNIAIDEDNMFVQYQRKTEGTIGGMAVTADSIGALQYADGVYTFPAVDPNYVKILPRDFMVNDDATPADATPAVFGDGTNTGVSIEDTSQELIATVNIPHGTTATEVAVWGSNTTKSVEVYEMNVNANGKGSTIGTGTTNGSAIDITDTASTSFNYLMIKVLVSSTNHRVWGGKVTLTQN